ncbi:MAG TPA: peptidoglycan-binding protein [Jiangellaceae bacterium]
MRDRRKTLLVIAAVAVGALVVGLAAGSRLTSPADAAARTAPPDPTAITVPVEFRTLESRVVTRGDASFAGAVEINLELTGLEAPPIVTGKVPEVGDEVTEGEAALEVAGRPVIALQGELPMYRTLRPGMTGPDVEQLEKTLEGLGYDPGTVDDTYTAATGSAVRELFNDAGYEPPAADAEASSAVDAAQDAVKAAQDEVRMAEQSLAEASAGPSRSERLMAEQAVDAAERRLAEAKQTGDKEQIAVAEDELELAEVQFKELLEGPDTSAQRQAVADAKGRLGEAQNLLSEAQAAAGTPLPAAEVVYVTSLPRRVDEVMVKRGDTVEGAVMSVSGADMVVTANVDQAARMLLDVEMTTLLDLPTGEQVEGVITDIEEAEGDEAIGYDVVIAPGELTAEQVEALRAANVRVTIPVTSTSGDVLAVPLAALTAGPGGESRVEVQRNGEMVLVEVEVGLTADGYAEVEPVDGELAEGDLVVVGERPEESEE